MSKKETEITGACCLLSKNLSRYDWTKFCWGWEDFYQKREPTCSEPAYLEGWQQAKLAFQEPHANAA